MKNPELRGIGTVFRYTVQQHYKTRSVIIFLVILFLLAVASMPVMLLLSGRQKEVTETQIASVYLRNETGYAFNPDAVHADARYAGVTIVETAEDDEALSQRVMNEETAAAAVLSIGTDKASVFRSAAGANKKTAAVSGGEQKQFTIRTFYGEDGSVTGADAETLNRVLEDALHQSLLESMDITEEQEITVNSAAVAQVAKIAEYQSGTVESNMDTHAAVNMAYSYLLLILCALSIGYVTQSCMEEKVSKLVESLMVSVSPVALLAGKLLAVAVFICCGFGLVGVGFFISYQIAGHLGGFSFLKPLLEEIMPFRLTALHFSAGTAVLLVICMLLTFAISMGLSGIAGSCISKTEDMQSASFLNMFFLMGGYLGSVFAPLAESDAVNLFCSLFPVTSPFCAFPNYTCGKIGLPVFLLALVIQAATAVLLVRTAGRVYKMMLLYRGSVPKPAQILRMLKEERAAAKAAAGKEAPHGKQ